MTKTASPAGDPMAHTTAASGRAGRLAALVLVGATSLGTQGCGGGDSPTQPRTTGMRVHFAVSPDPIVAQPLVDDPTFEWIATYVVTVTESGGVGGSVAGVAMTLNAASGGVEVITRDDPSETSAEAEGNRLEAHGRREMAFVTKYSVPGEGSGALINLLLRIRDDTGLQFNEEKTFLIR